MSKNYLMLRGDVWWYNRRIPSRFTGLDPRRRIRKSLDTYSLEEACLLRDKLVEADNQYWAALALAQMGDGSTNQAALAQYQAAVARADAAGFSYRPALEIATESAVVDLLARVETVQEKITERVEEKPVVEATLGGVEKPNLTLTQVLEMYIDKIALDDQMYKSKSQRASWRKVKTLAVTYFTGQFGDLPIDEITREHALAYKSWWADKVFPKDPTMEPYSGDTANRRIGGLRALYREYYRYIGQEDRPNPFRGINFKSKPKTSVAAFETDWVENKILMPGMFASLNRQLQLIIFMLIETGCRPSEIMNLQPADIDTQGEIPHIVIRPRSHGASKRELKSGSSERTIPLVGVSLEAAKRSPDAFPRYQDKNELFSANVLRAFRRRGLFPTKEHRIYSFRHSFEKRMQEANIDYGLRCLLMGHKTDRPAYGDGGSLAYRRDELLKIVHPFEAELFEAFDAEHGEMIRAS